MWPHFHGKETHDQLQNIQILEKRRHFCLKTDIKNVLGILHLLLAIFYSWGFYQSTVRNRQYPSWERRSRKIRLWIFDHFPKKQKLWAITV